MIRGIRLRKTSASSGKFGQSNRLGEKLASSEGMDALSLDPSFDGSETKIQQSNADVERLGLKS